MTDPDDRAVEAEFGTPFVPPSEGETAGVYYRSRMRNFEQAMELAAELTPEERLEVLERHGSIDAWLESSGHALWKEAPDGQ